MKKSVHVGVQALSDSGVRQHVALGVIVTNRAQPPRTDVPHFCTQTFPTRTDLFETMIECTATDHVIFS